MKPIRVVLENRVARFVSPFPKAMRHHFRFFSPAAPFSWRYKCGIWDGYISLLKRGRVGIGLFLEKRPALEASLGVAFEVKDLRQKVGFRKAEPLIDLRRFQVEALRAMMLADAGGTVLAATGTGKTALAGAYSCKLAGRLCFVVNELTLLDQAKKGLALVTGERIGVVGDSEFSPARITVATSQTLLSRLSSPAFKRWYSKLDVVILDEFDTQMNDRTEKILRAVNPKTVFGITATLEIKKADVLMRAQALLGPILYVYPISEGVREKVLSRGCVCQVLFPWTENPETTPKDPHACYRKRIVGSARRNSLIEALARIGVKDGRRVLVLVERVAHLSIMSRRLKDIPHEVVSGTVGSVKRPDRVRAQAALQSGEIRLLISNRVFSRGVDIPALDMIVDGCATRSRNSSLQRYGRGTRVWKTKKGLLYFDVGDWGKNRYAKSSRSRRSAFVAEKLPFLSLSLRDYSLEDIYGRAQREVG